MRAIRIPPLLITQSQDHKKKWKVVHKSFALIDRHWGRSMGTLQIQGQPQGIAPTNRSDVGAILYGCPSVIS